MTTMDDFDQRYTAVDMDTLEGVKICEEDAAFRRIKSWVTALSPEMFKLVVAGFEAKQDEYEKQRIWSAEYTAKEDKRRAAEEAVILGEKIEKLEKHLAVVTDENAALLDVASKIVKATA